MARKPHPPKSPGGRREPVKPVGLRIIGGSFRGRKLVYSGDPGVRPMKDRVREALFNLLGPAVKGTHALDLFAGTGALGLEALSRGAARATLIERHYPTAALVRQNIAALGVEDRCELVVADVFRWAEKRLPDGPTPWTVFCSPPYAFYVDRAEEMLTLIGRLLAAAPPGSLLAVEADDRFDFARLKKGSELFIPTPDRAVADSGAINSSDPFLTPFVTLAWDVRRYPPAVVGIFEKGPA